ncbi:hypothetical protein [Actinomadura rudentiformis]|uniref:Uncharacterized protein n=1 Tax=Actinomadura rudentiformis TaxID=359158 RepID=A0A6H9Y827_9ACTN|nr:hypothetical protein [Actinomadura rudentiformis]KAB2339205.1 hypothetical protein F8566_48850 [Actinomadura rudentiformis]
MSGWNPPPAPGGPPGQPYGYSPPMAYGPPPRRSNAGCVLGVILAGVAAVVLLVVGAVVVVAMNDHTINTPTVAGGRSRDFAAELRMSSTISSQRRIIQQVSGYKVDTVKSAVYGVGSDRWVFVGAEGDFDPDDLVSSFRRAVDRELTSSRFSTLTIPISNTGGDGKAACVSIRYISSTTSVPSVSTAMCGWMTDDTFGLVYPAVDSSTSTLSSARVHTSTSVASVMRSLRDDVEE